MINSLDLIATHMVGDYITQTNEVAINKLKDRKVRAKHVTLYTAGFVPLLLMSDVSLKKKVLFLLFVWITHFITDSRRWASDKGWNLKPIIVDQSIHLLTLAIARRIIR